MGTFNTLWTTFQCPYCGQESEFGFEVKFGFRNQLDLDIGDLYPWIPRKAFQNGGRPENGTVDADGYGYCEFCDHDFFVVVKIRNDKIQGIELNKEKPGYIQDEETIK